MSGDAALAALVLILILASGWTGWHLGIGTSGLRGSRDALERVLEGLKTTPASAYHRERVRVLLTRPLWLYGAELVALAESALQVADDLAADEGEETGAAVWGTTTEAERC